MSEKSGAGMESTWWRAPDGNLPPERALEWVANTIGAGARVLGRRRLVGGLVSSVHQLTVADRHGNRHRVVLRRYLYSGTTESPAEWVRMEARVLQALEGSNLPVPRLLAFDPEGAASGGCPA